MTVRNSSKPPMARACCLSAPVRFSRSLVPGWKFTSERPLPVISMYRAGVSRESATTRQTIPPMSEPMFSGIEKPPSWKAAKT